MKFLALALLLSSFPEALISVAPFVLIGILLIISALVSGSEVAFFGLTPADLSALEGQKESDQSPSAERVIELLKRPDPERAPRHLLATILVLNNLTNIIIILVSTVVMEQLFPVTSLEPWVYWTLHVGAVTFLIVLFGEVVPKVYATSHRVQFARFMSGPLMISRKMLVPVWKPLVKLGNWVEKKVEVPTADLSAADLEQALHLTADEERTDEEQKILEGIVTLGTKDAKQIMTARTDMESISSSESWDQLRAQIIESGYSRIPVHDGSQDEILGVLHTKDLLPHLGDEEVNWMELMRPVYFIPENKKIDDLMREFQERKTHIAIVVDEYGGTSGIITLEDIMEEIVGEISDEFDAEEIAYSRLDDRTFVIEAKTALIDVYRIVNLEDEMWEAAKGESDTLGGFITEQAGRILRNGESILFEGVELKIDAATPRKLLRVKITLPESEKDA
ncbi:MAG: gliding motility-associated protein GldE [Bacteroidetes bacterium]|nr:gliding motility-associated protein GldE [Bacteroidota bacterium]